MNYFRWIGAAALALSTLLHAQESPANQKHRVAILDFGYGTVRSSVQAVFGTDKDIGKGISDLLIDRLANDGSYRIVDRAAMDAILREQNFSNSDRADANTAAKIGKLLGADTIIVGDITQFGRDDKNTNAAASALSRWDKFGVGKVGLHKAKAAVAITARMIDVNTGEVMASTTGKGESTRSGTDLLGGGGSWGSSGSGSIDMGSSNFSQTIIGEAVNQAVQDVSTRLIESQGRLGKVEAPAAPDVSGLVADATGNTLIINVGSKAGLKKGDKLAVSRVERTVKDPATGKVLRTIDAKVGEFLVTNVDESSAEGKFTGTGTPKVGDAVKTIH